MTTHSSTAQAAVKPFVLEHAPSFGGAIHGLVQTPKAPGERPTIVVCHGFKGFMEWGFFPPLSDLLAERGFTVVRFNFSGSGMQPGDALVTDPDAFRRNTFSLELDELGAVLRALPSITQGRVDGDRVGLLGHSRGGGTVLLAAAHEEFGVGIRALVTWAAVSHYERYIGNNAESWRQDGFIPTVNGRTGQKLQLGVELLDDIENNAQRLDLRLAAARRETPWLIVHGSDDEAVPLSEGEDLAAWADGIRQLEVIDDGSHTFGAKHPFAGPTRELIRAMNATQVWFRRHLA